MVAIFMFLAVAVWLPSLALQERARAVAEGHVDARRAGSWPRLGQSQANNECPDVSWPASNQVHASAAYNVYHKGCLQQVCRDIVPLLNMSAQRSVTQCNVDVSGLCPVRDVVDTHKKATLLR